MRLRPWFLLLFLYLSAGCSVAATGRQTHPFSVHDMLAMDRICDPRVSPDGSRIVFVLRKTDLEANLGRTDLWLVAVDGTALRRLTSHPENDSNPRWAPDGKSVWFLSKRSGSSQVWRIRIDGGEAQQVTDQPLDVGNLVVSLDGETLAYLAMARPGYESDRFRIVLRAWPDGKERILTENWGRSPSFFCWSADGKMIYATAANTTARHSCKL
jgi:Tol biopolymer transport system component